MAMFEKGDYLLSFDLKSGYHHVDIASTHCKYLGLAWAQKFCVHGAPFRPGHHLFTKLMHPLVWYWRFKGLRIVVYLDDGLCAIAGEHAALAGSQLVRSTLAKAGFVAHPTKSIIGSLPSVLYGWDICVV